MSLTVRRIGAGDGALLRTVRLRALEDAPPAFGSTYEREAAYTDADWDERARLGGDAIVRVTFFAVDDRRDEVVGLVGGYRDDAAARHVELVSMWTTPRRDAPESAGCSSPQWSSGRATWAPTR